MFPITKQRLEEVLKEMGIIDITSATIRQICSLSERLEHEAGEKFVHLEIGNPGLEAQRIGVEAEIQALENGVANTYPAIGGIPALKENGSRFIKAFMDLDINPRGIPRAILPKATSPASSTAIPTIRHGSI